MDPLMISILAFLAVAGLVGAVAFLLAGQGNSRVAERLDQLIGRSANKDSSADMLLRQALQETDKKTLMDRMTPEFFNFSKTFEQADVNIRPSALFGIALALGLAGGMLRTFILAAGDYVVPAILGGAKGLMVGNLVASQILASQNLPMGAAMAIILIGLLSIVVLLALFALTLARTVLRLARGPAV